jgi:hypothetical protein
LAKHLATDGKATVDEAITRGYLIALSRYPSADELTEAGGFLRLQAESYRSAGKTNGTALAMADFCQALLCLNEFVYVD